LLSFAAFDLRRQSRFVWTSFLLCAGTRTFYMCEVRSKALKSNVSGSASAASKGGKAEGNSTEKMTT